MRFPYWEGPVKKRGEPVRIPLVKIVSKRLYR